MSELDKTGAIDYPPPLDEQERAVLSVFVDAVAISDSRLRNRLLDAIYETAGSQLEYDRERIDFIYSKALLMTERELVDEDTARLEEATADLPSYHETESAEGDIRTLGRRAVSGAQIASYSPGRSR